MASTSEASTSEASQGTDEEWGRPAGRNSEIWSHFLENVRDREAKKEKTRVKCNYCPSTFNYTGSTSNFWRHLKREHPCKIKPKEADSPNKDKPFLTDVFIKMGKETRAKVCNWRHKLTKSIEMGLANRNIK